MFERIETPRLVLRKPLLSDAEAIFARYSSDPEVTRLLAWPRHASLRATREFLEYSEDAWARWPAGPYIVESRRDGSLLGGAGLAFETPACAMTGYVFAKDVWGNGYAAETLQAVVEVARAAGVVRLYALCHPDNPASSRVLEKCGFASEGVLPRHSIFPNLNPHELCDVLRYALMLKPSLTSQHASIPQQNRNYDRG